MRITASNCPQVVHLELHTSDRDASSRFYSDLLQWQTERIDTKAGGADPPRRARLLRRRGRRRARHTAASVYSLLQRAHATIDERLPDRSQQATLRALDDKQMRSIVDPYTEAWTHNDVDAIVGS